MSDPVWALAYAIYDSENTTRLSEQDEDTQKSYARRARKLIYAIKSYRPKRERVAIAREIRR